MIGWIALRLARWGLSQRIAERAAPFALAGAALLFLGAAGGLWLHFHDRAVIGGERAKVEAKAAPAREAAADERLADQKRNDQLKDDYHDAIASSGPDAPPPASTVALNCQRLRRAGVAPLPAACGR